MKRTFSILALSAACTLAGCAGAQYENGQAEQGAADKRPMANAPTSTEDRQFVSAAANGGAYEVKASRVALEKSSDPQVRMIAQHMADDHAKANARLVTIARTRGLHASSAPSIEQEGLINRLQTLSGADFDREFLRQQRQAHRDTIALFETEANNGADSIIRDFASETLPTLREHLDMVNQHATALGMSD